MGTRSIELVLSDEKEVYISNDTIQGTVEGDLLEQMSTHILPIKNKAEQLLGTIDSAIAILAETFNEDARANINGTIENLQKTSSSLNEIVSYKKENIQHVILNAGHLAATLGNNTEDLEKTIKNLSAFSDTLSQLSVTPLLSNLTGASNQILSTVEKINSSNSSAGLLLNDNRLYISLNDMSQNLGSLIKNIETNPKRYLSFSAFDFSKEVNITTGGEAVSDKVRFKVSLIATETPVPLNSPFFEGLGEVEEYASGGTYTYFVGNSSSYNEILKLHNQVKNEYPNAAIAAFKNGRLIKLEKAMKLTR
jgi:phospholipid/cholesterol/gamma-HCH transport system substrate-binding protein